MFQPSGMFSVSGNLDNDTYSKINEISYAFHKVLLQIIQKNNYDRTVFRLLKPVNTLILLDNHFIHFVCTNKSVGGALSIVHSNIKDKADINNETAIEISKREVGFEDPFGFSITNKLIYTKKEELEELVVPFVKEYINAEENRLEKLARIVKINPIFQGRDFYINEKTCFVLMPFNENKVQEIYEDFVKKTVVELGYTCNRADDIYGTTSIIEDIWKSINEAKFLIADVTGRNPNVFYEIGVAHTIGKNVLIISQDLNDIPFDLRHLRCIIYDNTPRGSQTLAEQLKLSIQKIK